jgi:transposase
VRPEAAQFNDKLNALAQRVAVVEGERDAAQRERDEYRQLYVGMVEAYRKLEARLTRHVRERFEGDGEQLVLSLLSMMAPGECEKLPEGTKSEIAAHSRARPTGRKPLPEELPSVDIEVTPLDVQRRGLDAFERIGEDVTETVERRLAAVVVVRTVRPKYVPKTEAPAAQKVLQAPAPQLPIPRLKAGPGLLADSIVKRWDDHLPLHRMERIYGREGLPIARSTICGWHFAAAELVKRVVDAMWVDALAGSLLCMDATGVLVRALEKCRKAHFFVVIAPGRHVLFGFTPKHDSDAVKALVKDFKGHLVLDAHAVYDFLFENGDVIECGCWAHARRYWFKALESDAPRARHAMSLIGKLFEIERTHSKAAPEAKLRLRQQLATPIVDAFFAWCDDEALKVLAETPAAKAIGYARNQREALRRFLGDGRVPLHNNWSENELRREALGRNNWLFLGNDEGGAVNATFVSLLASCKLHGIEPLGYLRDLFCLLPDWPSNQALQLAPANWNATLARSDVQDTLLGNVFRQVALGNLEPLPNRS